MEPYEILTLVRRFTPLLLAHLVLGAIAGYAIAAFSPPVFTSTASAFVAAGRDGTQSVTSSSTLISAVMPTLVELGTSQPVLDDVAAMTGIDPNEINHSITVTNPENTLIIEVSADASSAEKAQMIAQAEIQALRKFMGDRYVAGNPSSPEKSTINLNDVDTASLPSAPSGPSKARYLLYGGVIGAGIGAGACSYLYVLSRLKRSAAPAATAAGI